ncbi:MAG TPA: sulfotransferase [Saprospiraceae bacterium]|nr:sulfotransferase [Saprospiraceae bacterium]
MRILIGGSPSTGSSVFRQILNRHPKVFCGPETNLFCYPALYRHWRSSKKRILLPGMLGLHNTDVRTMRGVHLEDGEFGWTHKEIRSLLGSHTSFPEFCDAFFNKPLIRNAKVHWAEKTPANVLQFSKFMQSFEDAYIIHTTRSPYDTVTSLVSRGMSPYLAASIYLLYTAHGLAAQEMPGYIEARYESLVSDAAGTLDSEILQPLGLQYVSDMLSEGNPRMAGISKMQGWRSDELDHISDRSISRYHDAPEQTQVSIATALASIRLTEKYMKWHRLQHDTIEMICAGMHYHYFNETDRIDRRLVATLQRDREKNIRRQWLQRWVSSPSMYPIELV